QFLGKTLLGVVLFSVLTDLFTWLLPTLLDPWPVTDNMLLSALYGGIAGGVGGGLIYRSGASAGGTSILGRVVQIKTGIPLSQVFLMTDGIIVALMGITFGWEVSLYALLMLFLWGMAADYTLEGPSSVRAVTIVTEQPDAVTLALREGVGRTVSRWQVTGGYSGAERSMLLCTVHRPQVTLMKELILQADPQAFFVIGDAHQAIGGGFTARISENAPHAT
ncbi:MAG: YitT family protein, partial [Caldilineaceae bacterium]